MADATMVFPRDFLWGTATAAYQNEGFNTNSDWWHWEQQPGAILHGHRSGRACDWWENAEADLDRAAELGTNALRLSLAWDRIEPEPARFDADAIARYREILQAARARGLAPMVTLHHFVNPLWLHEKGDFNTGVAVDYFGRFARKVATDLGDLVDQWITINEPLVYVVLRYLDGLFPPVQRGGLTGVRQALPNLLAAHAAAYHAIKEARPDAPVGVAKHIRPIRPATTGTLAHRWARWLDWLFNDFWHQAATSGRLRWPIGHGRIRGLAKSFDFVGINYYSYSYALFPPRPGKLYSHEYGDGAILGDGDFGAVDPAGLYDAIVRVLPYGKPIYITENGMPDRADDRRPAFIIRHLREVWRAVSFNFPVMGYYHWTLVDNFEWERGWTQRFGLYELDPDTQARTLRRSGQLYGEICRTNSVSSTMARHYAPAVLESLFPG